MAVKFTYAPFSYEKYKESDDVENAKNALNTQLSQKPEGYTSQWQTQIDDTIKKIMGREDFQYDFNGDALYQQYKDKYIKQGKMAMADTIGQASAMTGGYGNSYAQSVGNQAYQASLDNLNDIIPELYQLALDQYNQKGQDLYNQYALLGDRESQDYGRYRDQVSDWQTERDYLANQYDSERNFDYSKYNDERNFGYGMYSDNRNYAYQTNRDAIADEQWQANFDEAKRQYEESMALNKEQWEWEKSQAESSSSGTGGGSGSGNGSGSGSGGGNNTTATGTNLSGIESQASKYKSNSSLASYLDGLASSGEITEEQADRIYAKYADVNEKYNQNNDGSSSISYRDMVGSTNGWSVVNDGGVNWLWGIDNNAIVEAPNGERIRLDDLKNKLIAEGMSKSDAKDVIKRLQKNLGA